MKIMHWPRASGPGVHGWAQNRCELDPTLTFSAGLKLLLLDPSPAHVYSKNPSIPPLIGLHSSSPAGPTHTTT